MHEHGVVFVNEVLTRDLDSNSGTTGNNHALVYDLAGNLTSDPSADRKYEWDAFYRLRKVKTQAGAPVAEYRYNGLGHRIGTLEDTDLDSDVDVSDLWYYSSYDERWRMVATYRGSDADPKERFVHHQAGGSGHGGSSYIDLVAFRERDANIAWTSASDGTLEERLYYCQNQHADVVALITAAGAQREMARYSAYGVPFGLPVGDTNSDGDCDQADQNQVRDWALATPAVYDVRGDLDLDGDVDLTDRDTLRDNYKGVTLGRGVLSADAVRNQRGVAGYVAAGYEPSTYLIRHRVFPSELGVWASRDPVILSDGASAYGFCGGYPASRLDPDGKDWITDALATVAKRMSQFSFTRSCTGACKFDKCFMGWWDWNFKLSATAGTICAGSSGYIIQHLTVKDEFSESCPDVGYDKDYYEAFEIEPAADSLNPNRPDMWMFPSRKAAGTRRVHAEAQFVCKSLVGDLKSQWENDDSDWAGAAPNTRDQPWWWGSRLTVKQSPTDPNNPVDEQTTDDCCRSSTMPPIIGIPTGPTITTIGRVGIPAATTTVTYYQQ